jgi:hypothetical protein
MHQPSEKNRDVSDIAFCERGRVLIFALDVIVDRLGVKLDWGEDSPLIRGMRCTQKG